MKGSMAMGSKRSCPAPPRVAAVISEDMVAPMKTPCSQERDSFTRGTTVLRRPPKRMAEIGTPSGLSHSGAMTGHCLAGVVKREFLWAAGPAGFQALFQGRRSQSTTVPGSFTSPSSHQ